MLLSTWYFPEGNDEDEGRVPWRVRVWQLSGRDTSSPSFPTGTTVFGPSHLISGTHVLHVLSFSIVRSSLSCYTACSMRHYLLSLRPSYFILQCRSALPFVRFLE